MNTLNQDSVIFYNKFDEWHYEDYYTRVNAYIDSVNRVILREAALREAARCKYYLDVGAGNGKRSLKLARLMGCEDLTVMDSSEGMCKLCTKSCIKNVIHADIEDYPGSGSYNVITALGNVFGHIDDPFKALQILRRISRHNCKLIFDVNNRYNCFAYGFLNVAKNIIDDYFWYDKGNGKFPMLNYDKELHVKIYNPYELDNLIKKAGFTKIRKKFIDYKNGHMTNCLRGQILYIVAP